MKNTIIRYKEINSFFEAINSELRTDIPEFCIFPLNKITKNVVLAMKPYQKDFNHITLVLKSKNSGIQIDEQHIQKKDNFLFFLSTKHIYSWQRDQNIKGYTIFFKSSFLNFYAEQFEIDFSFFDLAERNIIELSSSQIKEITADFENLFKDFSTPSAYREQIIQTQLLSVLYKFKGIQEEFSTTEIQNSKKKTIVFKFKNLVNNLFISTKQVNDYAEKLFISSNNLNNIVKEMTGKTAKETINEKVILEAKRLLRYTSNDIAQIAFNIGFDEPTHFIRFFKAQTLQTPKEFRTQKM